MPWWSWLVTRVVDADVIRELHELWDPFGCAICQGKPVDIHHLRKRSQGGPDSLGNGIGLCSSFSKLRHHDAVEEGRIEIYPTQNGGLAWQDRRSGESGVCRF